MGAANSSLQHVLNSPPGGIERVLATVKSLRSGFLLSKDAFLEGWAQAGHVPPVTLFRALDTDGDGLVDVFEVATLLALYARGTWQERTDILFQIFDFNAKGSLTQDELRFMGCTIIRVLSKFLDTEVDEDLVTSWRTDPLQTPSDSGFSTNDFFEWFKASSHAKELRLFIDENATHEKSEFNDMPAILRTAIIGLQSAFENQHSRYCALKRDLTTAKKMWSALAHVDTKVQSPKNAPGRIPTDTDPKPVGGQDDADTDPKDSTTSMEGIDKIMSSRDLYLLTQIDILMVRIEKATSMQRLDIDELINLVDAATMDPQARIRQRQVWADVEAIQKETERNITTCMRAIECLIDLRGGTRSSSAQKDGGKHEGAQRKPRVTGIPADYEGHPTIVIKAFTPKGGYDMDMLTLDLGENIRALGQDPHGWWYGRKDNGQEGWFPPSYVSLP